jgi:purine-cytosine permease-like protein
MGLISAIIVGFVVFILIQYFAPGLSTLVAVLIAGFIAGMLAEGLL